MRKAIFLLQAGLVLIGAGIALFVAGQDGAVAALYGGSVALANTLMLGRRVERVSRVAVENAQYGMVLLYISAVVRFVFILVAVAVGLGVLKLLPVPMIADFVAAQFAFVLASVVVNRAASTRFDKKRLGTDAGEPQGNERSWIGENGESR